MAIAGMLAVVLSNIFSDSFKAQHHMELASDREAIKRNFLETVNCGLTMKASGGCTPNAAMVVNRKDASGAAIPMTTTTGVGTKFGKWTVKAKCNSLGDGITILAARLADGGTLSSKEDKYFRPDPLSGNVVTWDDPKSLLFPKSIDLCMGSSSNTAEWVNVDSGAVSGGSAHIHYTDGKDHSPTAICRNAGFTTFSGACRTAVSGRKVQGSVVSNQTTYYPNWALSCQYGNGVFFFSPTVPSEIVCIK